MEARASRPRFWIALQPSIVRLYKIAGLVALTAILIGLVSFLVVNVFYFFDHTWVRPVRLSPAHHKVIEASTQLADAKRRASELATEKVEIETSLKEIDRKIELETKSLAEVGTTADAPKTPEQWLLHFKIEETKVDKENELGKRAPLLQRQESLKLRTEDQDAIVTRLAQSPYLRAANQQVVLAFVPYTNRDNVKIGTKLYSCAWGLVGCSVAGKVTNTIEGEVEEAHPNDESIQRGYMVEIDVTAAAADKNVLFLGSKPLWLF